MNDVDAKEKNLKIWLPSIRANSGADRYMLLLEKGLNQVGCKAEITWFNKYYEFFPPLISKQRNKFDIIHANSSCAFAFEQENTPLSAVMFHMVRNSDYQKYCSPLQKVYHKWVNALENKTIKHAKSVVAISKYTESDMNFFFPYAKIKTITTGIDADFFVPPQTKRTFKGKSLFKLLFVGNLSKRKGFDIVCRTMEKLGSGFILYYTSGLKNKSKSIYPPNMVPIGKVSDLELRKLYHSVDALFFPSRFEGFGYCIAEAMGCGLPVVTSNVSSMPELVINGKGGFTCSVDNEQEYMNKINELADSPKLLQSMGEFNRAKIEAENTLIKMSESYIKYFENMNSSI